MPAFCIYVYAHGISRKTYSESSACWCRKGDFICTLYAAELFERFNSEFGVVGMTFVRGDY